jgi:hypothetical protein
MIPAILFLLANSRNPPAANKSKPNRTITRTINVIENMFIPLSSFV